MTRTMRLLALIGGLALLLVAMALAVPTWGADPSATSGAFSPTGSLAQARSRHTATLLPDGRVLVVGGQDWEGESHIQLASSELWDPATRAFTGTGSLAEARAGHTATLLRDGRVLVVGGPGTEGVLAPAELWDPVSGAFTGTGSLGEARAGHTATLLRDGRVLVVGGHIYVSDSASVSDPASAELWDPKSSTFVAAGTLGEARAGHTATLLADGRVLVVGGQWDMDRLASAELWDPVSNTFVTAGSLAEARSGHTATRLADGRVLLIGGGGSRGWVASAEIWDPVSGSFSQVGSLVEPRWLHTATLLPDGRVLVVGGNGDSGDPLAAPAQLALVEVWDPVTSAFGPAGSLCEARESHTATALPQGGVLVIGGYGTDGVLASAELWGPGSPLSACPSPSASATPDVAP